MRFRMMPTAKKKLGGMSLFMRQSDGSVAGPNGSPRGASVDHSHRVVGLPATPAPVNGARTDRDANHFGRNSSATTTQAQLPQLQPPPDIVSTNSRLETLATSTAPRSIPLPTRSRFSATSQPATTMSLPPSQHFHPMQRTRTSASDQFQNHNTRGQNAWEDSTVASMFDGQESSAGSDRHRGLQLNGHHGRHFSDNAFSRTHQPQAQAQGQAQTIHNPPQRHDENLPFVIGENGLLKVITSPPLGHTTSAPPLGTSITAGILPDQETVKLDDEYQDNRPYYESTPTRVSSLRRKLPHREPRDLKRESFSDRGGGGYTSDVQSGGMSPERSSEAGEQIEKIRRGGRFRREPSRDYNREREQEQERERELERERERERQLEIELRNKRSTIFENLTPVEQDEPTFNDPTFNNTRAAIIHTFDSEVGGGDVKEPAVLRTPRANRHLPAITKAQNMLTNTALAQTNSRRLLREPNTATAKESVTKKRRHSLDYNDAELNSMSYSDLRAQAFDYDPQQAALQQTTVPTGGSLQERLQHYKTKDVTEQQQFFTRLSMDEWEDSGDWFLEQFGAVMQKMKNARREKRKLIQNFEDEISAREEAVRGKIEGIGKTLEELKEEGKAMMAGKEADAEF